jgi:hypothetical protein
MAENWMEAAGRNGIPSAFLVDTKGVIAWIGHPMELKESVLDEVLAGNFDVQKAAVDYAQAQKAQAQMQAVWTALNQARQGKKWDEAIAQLEKAEKLTPADQRQGLDMTRFDILLAREDYPGAYNLAAKISEANKDNAMLQNELAWRIATDKGIKQRDLDLAETIANRANEAAKGKDPAVPGYRCSREVHARQAGRSHQAAGKSRRSGGRRPKDGVSEHAEELQKG